MGFGVACLIHFLGSDNPVGAVLLNMAVFGAVLSYMLQMISFLSLRHRMPDIARPYRSPVGVPGAAFALVIALVCFGSLFASDPVYRRVVLATAVFYALGIAYFAFYAFYARKRLVFSPEEAFAEAQRVDR